MARTTTERGLDRLVNFSDAVTAVAVTLLVLPLIDLVEEGRTVDELFSTYGEQFFSFVAVFLLMIWIWSGHHRFWELIVDYDYVLVWMNALWLVLLSLFPVVAGFTFQSGLEHGQAFAYLSLLALLILVRVGMAAYARSRGDLLRDEVEPGDFHLFGDALRGGSYLFLAGLVALFPDKAPWLMAVGVPVGIGVRRVVQARDARATPVG